MTIRSPDGATTSESSFDESLVDSLSYFNPSLDIAKWNQTVSGTAISGKDLFFSSPEGFQDMPGLDADAFFQKDDSASVSSSMADSAYQSQPDASRRGNYQIRSPQDTRSHMGDHFFRNEIYSPSLSSDTYNNFQGQQSDMSQMILPSSMGESDLGDGSFRMADFANYSNSQGYGHFSNPSLSRFTPTSEIDMPQNWSSADQSFNQQFNSNAFRQPAQRFYDSFAYQSQDATEVNFDTSHTPHRHLRRSQTDLTTVSGSEIMQASSVNQAQGMRRASVAEQAFQNFVVSPSTTNVTVPQHNVAESQFVGTKDEATEETKDDEVDEEEELTPSQAAAAQSLEDEQGKVARTHPLYQAQPGEDDLYHCPNEGQSGCNHKPTKLKCNYDKYVDSHLRPFRCKVKSCVGVQFSSTACLLRHEREAHGMHGHGSKPHLCTYPDCERSMPGNGFPRRYNLFDHMKRVHDYTGSTSPAERSPPVQQVGLKRQHSTRKRKSTADDGAEKRQKTKQSAQAIAAHNQLMQRRSQLQQEFNNRIEGLVLVLKGLEDPKELDGIQLTKDVVALQEISSQYKGLG